jgi:hypothetical protein
MNLWGATNRIPFEPAEPAAPWRLAARVLRNAVAGERIER